MQIVLNTDMTTASLKEANKVQIPVRVLNMSFIPKTNARLWNLKKN